MRKAHRLLGVTALAFLAVGLTALGASASRTASHAAKADYKVAVLNPGTKNDGSWGQAVDEGALQYGKKAGATVTLVDALETPAQYQQQASSFANKGYDLVIIANGSDPQVVTALAKQFPKTMFCETAATIPNMAKNVCTNNLTYYDGDFLAGALAAMVSKSGHVGSIGGFSFPQLNWELNGFALGARYVNPKIKVSNTYVNTWTDVGVTRAAAQAQITSGADVIFSATDQATQGLYAAAQAKGDTYAISQYFDTHSQAPKVVLTSVLFNLQGSVGQLIALGAAGKLKNKDYLTDFNAGAGKLAPFYDLAPGVVTPAIQARLHKIEALIASGKLKVPALAGENQGVTYSLSKFPPAPA
jgi:basic membrane lipoprotein Med (substrate-binding protein (PBP1-ABC) superfamily)